MAMQSHAVNRHTFMKRFFEILLMLFISTAALRSFAQGTAFSYNGWLNDNGKPANGLYDLRFSVFDSGAGGILVAGPLVKPATEVSNGVFTLTLDFGAGVFTGPARWLEIGVRTNGGSTYTNLSARQAVLASPYAIFAGNSAGGGSGVWSLNGANAYYSVGNVGIGTATPSALLDVRGAMTIETGGDATLYLGTGNAELNRFLNLINSPGLPSAAGLRAGGVLVSDSYAYATPGKNNLIVKGAVAVGTATPPVDTKLTVRSGSFFQYGFEHTDGTVRLSTYLDGVAGWIGTRSNHPLNFYVNDGLPSMTVDTAGNVGIGTETPLAKLDVRGTTRTGVLTITGGADRAEPFPTSGADTEKGSVMIIDDENPGRLKLSTQACDTRVAGIISGANGINTGIALHQEGVLSGGQNLALSGRVYVKADASYGAIKPGDLLTTSDTPGHAMKVKDHARAQGAILGKAMSGLKEGKGMVLVLVTLQ